MKVSTNAAGKLQEEEKRFSGGQHRKQGSSCKEGLARCFLEILGNAENRV